MQRSTPTDGPTPRRRLFGPRPEPPIDDPQVAAIFARSSELIMQRLEEGLAAIEKEASAIMRQVADEIWKVSSPDAGAVQSKILEGLARDQAIRGLIAHSDERFQSIDLRVGRMEESLSNVDLAAKQLGRLLEDGRLLDEARGPGFQSLDERVAGIEQTLVGVNRTTQELKAQMQRAIEAISGEPVQWMEPDEAASPAAIRDRLNALQTYLMSVVEYLGERDTAIVEWLKTTTRHSSVTTKADVTRLVEALQGRLLARMEESETALRDAVALHVQGVHDRVEQQARMFGEGLAEGLTVLETKTLARLDGQAERIEDIAGAVAEVREAARASTEFVQAALHQRLDEVMARLEADSEKLRRMVSEQAASAGERATRELDDRLARLTEFVNSAMGWTVDRIGERIEQETLRSVETGMADLIALFDRRFVNLDRSLDEREARLLRGVGERADRVADRVGDRVERMDIAMRAGLGALEESVAERTAQSVEESLAPARAEIGRATRAITEGAAAIEVMRRAVQDSTARLLDERIAGLARLIRSDNEALARRLEVVEEQAAAKEAIRAINELSASLSGEITAALDSRIEILAELLRRETRSTSDVVSKVGGALADRFDRTAARIGERFDRDVELVVDQLGETMQTMASGLQRVRPRAD